MSKIRVFKNNYKFFLNFCYKIKQIWMKHSSTFSKSVNNNDILPTIIQVRINTASFLIVPVNLCNTATVP